MQEVDSGAVRGGREGPGGVARDFAGFQARVTGLLAVPPLRCRTPGEGRYGSHVSALAGPPGCVSPLSLDRIPQILDMVSELEFNLETTPRINCAAAGNPFPVRGSVELRKPDGTVLLVSPVTPAQGPCPSRPLTPRGFLQALPNGLTTAQMGSG